MILGTSRTLRSMGRCCAARWAARRWRSQAFQVRRRRGRSRGCKRSWPRSEPKNVLIYLGTNFDSSFPASIQSLVSLVQAAGARVLVATVPTSAANTAIVNSLKGVTVVHFDVALTASVAASALNASLYNSVDVDGNPYNDWVHPNAAGHAAMAARVLQDAPFLEP